MSRTTSWRSWSGCRLHSQATARWAEAVCSILRAGFSETEAGPFVFPPDLVTTLLAQQTLQTPRIGVFVGTACSFVSSLSSGPAHAAAGSLAGLMPWVISLLQALPGEKDALPDLRPHPPHHSRPFLCADDLRPGRQTRTPTPTLVRTGSMFMNRAMIKDPERLFQLQPTSALEFFFLFTLRVLDGNEPLPKQAARRLLGESLFTFTARIRSRALHLMLTRTFLTRLFRRGLLRSSPKTPPPRLPSTRPWATWAR